MAATTNEYHFVSHWRVGGTIDEVADVLGDAARLPEWWPAVYLDVKVRPATDGDDSGQLVTLLTKGWLPYTLRWGFRVTESNRPHGWRLEAWGDFVGSGVWTLIQDGPVADITYDWRIRADKPLLRYGSAFMRPLFAANHRWAMARGEESLRLELQRRRATTPAEAAAVPPPPGPTFPDNLRPALKKWLSR